ncbi:hypothetical protein BO94DRAFT_208855 [Aspergillus sclerotioniger CBS 115572]|uniref:Uncharacterized protein n=1 Tax=Aspergillus sclerotioniger CBS 115572 TaxID=1450535 RepID=A0A317VP22_9EURO|nr:hypothetical protein BO94DRAFT_208855 [Aspergillus sclerotioniger CBS 115572]PWY76103.1 hypothetical protein BO94DRAFT_208855 [Aspergillus sclerotioniger CBS 115572]
MAHIRTSILLLIFISLVTLSIGSESSPVNSPTSVPRVGPWPLSLSAQSQYKSFQRTKSSVPYTQKQSFLIQSSVATLRYSPSDSIPGSPSILVPPPSSTPISFTSIQPQDQSPSPASSPALGTTLVGLSGHSITPAAVWTSGTISGLGSSGRPDASGTVHLTTTVSPNIKSSTSQEPTAFTSSESETTTLAIITAYTVDASTVSVSGTVTTNTHTRTGDSSHATAIVPLLVGCWFCPSIHEGILLWGMSLPGIYPPPVKPPLPAWPTITIGENLIPTPDPSSDTDDKTTASSSTSSSTHSSMESPSTTETATQSTSFSSQSTETLSTATSTASDSCDASPSSKRPYSGQPLSRRTELTVELDDPLGTALSYLGVEGLQSASLFVSNKQEGTRQKRIINTWAMGVGGTYELPRGGVTIEGVHLTGKIPWMIRWDKDPVKGVHVNGVWGKGPGRVKVAYKFHPDENGGDSIGWSALVDNVTKLNTATKIKPWGQRTLEEQRTLTVSFKDGGNEADAVQAIIRVWSTLITTGSSVLVSTRMKVTYQGSIFVTMS